jgi:hypothetical protein
MAIRDTFPVVIVDGDQLNDGFFNGVPNVLGTQALIGRMNARLAGITLGQETGSGFAFEDLLTQTTTSFVDTSGSSCTYSEYGLVAFCDVLDLFDNASIDAAIWTTAVTSSATVTEASGALTLAGSDTAGSNDDASAISDGASGLQIDGQNTEVIISYSYSYSTGSGTPDCQVKIQVSDGSNHVDVLSDTSTSTGVSSSETGFLRVTYDDANNRVDVWKTAYSVDGVVVSAPTETLLSDNTSVAAVTANQRYIRFFTRAKANSGTSTTTLNVYAVGYRKNGAGAGDAVFESSAESISASTGGLSFVQWINAPSSETHAVSLNGGSNYTSQTQKTWATSTSGSSFQFKITVAKPTTITADAKNIPVALRWGALYA